MLIVPEGIIASPDPFMADLSHRRCPLSLMDKPEKQASTAVFGESFTEGLAQLQVSQGQVADMPGRSHRGAECPVRPGWQWWQLPSFGLSVLRSALLRHLPPGGSTSESNPTNSPPSASAPY